MGCPPTPESLPLDEEISTIQTIFSGFRVSYILANDSTVYYEEYGAGETLVLLPGLLGSIESDWRRFVPEFARRAHVIAVDLRGHGRTDNPRREMTLDLLVRDLRVFCETLELQRPFLCTYGLASLIPLEYCRAYPGAVGGLLLHAPSEEAPDAVTHDELRRRHPGLTDDASMQSFFTLVSGLAGTLRQVNLSESFRHITIPTLLTFGDAMDTADSYLRLAEGQRHIRHVRIPSSGAIPQTLQKLPFVAITSEFIGRTTNPAHSPARGTESSD